MMEGFDSIYGRMGNIMVWFSSMTERQSPKIEAPRMYRPVKPTDQLNLLRARISALLEEGIIGHEIAQPRVDIAIARETRVVSSIGPLAVEAFTKLTNYLLPEEAQSELVVPVNRVVWIGSGGKKRLVLNLEPLNELQKERETALRVIRKIDRYDRLPQVSFGWNATLAKSITAKNTLSKLAELEDLAPGEIILGPVRII